MYEQHIVVDFEMNPVAWTTREELGVSLNYEIIEIGAVRVDKNFKTADSFSRLVKPEYESKVFGRISKLTHISNEALVSAPHFKEALGLFSEWIGGNSRTRVYSWGKTDLIQLKNECRAKAVPYPANMKRWMDLQRVYPRLADPGKRSRRPISLKDAALYYSLAEFNENKAHRAIYDAKVTAGLLIQLLDGSYKEKATKARKVLDLNQEPFNPFAEALARMRRDINE